MTELASIGPTGDRVNDLRMNPASSALEQIERLKATEKRMAELLQARPAPHGKSTSEPRPEAEAATGRRRWWRK